MSNKQLFNIGHKPTYERLEYNESLDMLEFVNCEYRQIQALLVHLISTQPYTVYTRIFGNNIASARESVTDDNVITTHYRFSDTLTITVGMSKLLLTISVSRFEPGFAPLSARASIVL